MEFTRLEAENFLIIGSANVQLNNRGLTIIEGINNDDTTSESNGSGKSSLVEAIYWCLFGDTLRSLEKADDIVNSNVGKNCRVKLSFNEGGKDYTVERYRKHSKHKNNLYLTINGVDSRGKDNKETQEYVEEIIGIDKTAFAASIVFGQGYSKNLRRFGELTDKEQKACLEKVLDLEIFASAHTVAKRQAASVSNELDKLESKVASEHINYTKQVKQFKLFKEKADTFNSDQAEELAELVTSQQNLVDKRENLETALQSLEVPSVEDIQAEVVEYSAVKAELLKRKEKLIESYNEKKTKITTTVNSIKTHIAKLKQREAKLASGDLDGEQCYYCGGRVLKKTIERIEQDIDFEINDNQTTLNEVTTKLEKLNKLFKKKRKSIVDDISSVEELISFKQSEIVASSKAASQKSSLEAQIKAIGKEINKLNSEYTKVEEKENPWVDLAVEYKTKAKEIKVVVKELNVAIEEVKVKLQHIQFWKDGFSRKGLRSFMLDRIIPFLNQKTNHYLGILTDGGVSVTFSATKTLNSGEVRENFNVQVNNHKASQTYKGNSGGERRRIDLAIALAINDLIAMRSGKAFNIILLDEVFENVDETGSYYVIKVLEEIAKKKSSVLVITHQQSLSDYFHNRIVVERNNGQSTIH